MIFGHMNYQYKRNILQILFLAYFLTDNHDIFKCACLSTKEKINYLFIYFYRKHNTDTTTVSFQCFAISLIESWSKVYTVGHRLLTDNLKKKWVKIWCSSKVHVYTLTARVLSYIYISAMEDGSSSLAALTCTVPQGLERGSTSVSFMDVFHKTIAKYKWSAFMPAAHFDVALDWCKEN